ncbi:MAG: copper resistance protein B [Halomonadaceae bacterium T82-2]|nr:MAG: copper resistance protein B [Halomonadaceae bacterium T82-2]
MRFTTRILFGVGTLALVSTAQAQTNSSHDAPPGWGLPMTEHNFGTLLVDRLEYVWTDENKDAIAWDFQGWYGGDFQRLYIKGEGKNRQGDGEDAEFETLDLLYSHLIADFWELQGGIGYQGGIASSDHPERTFAVIGLLGTIPYQFEVDTALRVSDEGDVSASLEAEYEIRMTQRVILQPRVEAEAATSDVEEFSVVRGLNYTRAGMRLRYEVTRKLAPYIGTYWEKQYGKTAELTREALGETEGSGVVAGVRMWF